MQTQYSEIGLKLSKRWKPGEKVYRSRNYLEEIDLGTITSPDGVSRIILKMVRDYMDRIRTVGRPPKNGQKLMRYILIKYLSGARDELLAEPLPIISVHREKDIPVEMVTISRLNFKHFPKPLYVCKVCGTENANKLQRTRHREVTGHKGYRIKGAREIILQHIPIFDSTEREMWRLVLNDFEQTDISDVFEFARDLNGGKKRSGNLTHAIERALKHNMKTPDGRLERNASITPHMLRHLRSYNLYLQRRMSEEAVRLFFGWNDTRMLRHYAYMSSRIKSAAVLQEYKRYFAEIRSKKKAAEIIAKR